MDKPASLLFFIVCALTNGHANENVMKTRKLRAWQSALLATSGLAAMFFASSELWQQGLQQWAFLLALSEVEGSEQPVGASCGDVARRA